MQNFVTRIHDKGTQKMLIALVFAIAALVLTTQAGLFSDRTRGYFTDIDVYEGTVSTSVDETLFYGELILEIKGIDLSQNPNIPILVNGDVVGVFDTYTVTVPVRNNAMVEVDGTKTKNGFSVEVVGATENIANKCVGTVRHVSKKIAVISRVFIR